MATVKGLRLTGIYYFKDDKGNCLNYRIIEKDVYFHLYLCEDDVIIYERDFGNWDYIKGIFDDIKKSIEKPCN